MEQKELNLDLTQTISSEAVLYAAGLFDGEGTVAINKNSQRQKPTYSLIICIAMTHKPVLEYMTKQFGGKVRPVSVKRYKEQGYSPQWIWLLSSYKAMHFLEFIQPYIKVKKEHVDIGIQFQKEYQPRTGSTRVAKYKLRLSEDYRTKLKSLHHPDRGRKSKRTE